MRAGRRFKGGRATLLAFAAFLALVVTSPGVRAGGVPQAGVKFHSGPVGVTKADVVRVNVTNLNTTTQQAQISILDDKGAPKGKKALTVSAGQTSFFDITFANLVGRLVIRTMTQCQNNLFLVNTEIYDAVSLRTRLTIDSYRTTGPADANGVGQEVLFDATAIVKEQTARLSVANLDVATIEVTLTFLDDAGKVLQTSSVSVPPKQIGSFDYLGTEIVGRKILRGQITFGTTVLFLSSIEAFDTVTGRADLIYQEGD
jgi:hypothetical protein